MNSARNDRRLVIGYGNPLRGDDAAGLRAAEELRALGIEAVGAHQLTPELAEPIARLDRVIFIDADARLAPGEIRIEAVEAPAGRAVLEHHATPAALLVLARELYGRAPQAWFIGIGAESFECGAPLSAAAGEGVRRAVASVVSGNPV